MSEYKYANKSKTPFDNFFFGFKVLALHLGYGIGGFMVAIGLFSTQLVLGIFIIYLSYEINKSLREECLAEMEVLKKEQEDKDDDNDIGPFSPA